MPTEELDQLRALENEARAELDRAIQVAPSEAIRQALKGTKQRAADEELRAARATLDKNMRRIGRINSMMGEVKAFGLSHQSLKVPVWLAVAVVLALCAVFTYAAIRMR